MSAITYALMRECDGDDLVEFLNGRGFHAELVRADDRFELSVAADARPAVELWLGEREPGLVPTPVEDVVVLALPGD